MNRAKVRTHTVSGRVWSPGYELILLKYSLCQRLPDLTAHTRPLSKYSDDSSNVSSLPIKLLKQRVHVFQQQAVAYLFLQVFI